jgi:hypothetical protein
MGSSITDRYLFERRLLHGLMRVKEFVARIVRRGLTNRNDATSSGVDRARGNREESRGRVLRGL